MGTIPANWSIKPKGRLGIRRGFQSSYHSTSYDEGASPYAGVILDGKGNLYGTTYQGGKYYYGTVFEVTP